MSDQPSSHVVFEVETLEGVDQTFHRAKVVYGEAVIRWAWRTTHKQALDDTDAIVKACDKRVDDALAGLLPDEIAMKALIHGHEALPQGMTPVILPVYPTRMLSP